MPWIEQWSVKIDGTQLNDRVNFFTTIPDIEDIDGADPILVEIPGDYPVFVRSQPLDATININVQMTSCDWATYQSRLAFIRSVCSMGPHTLAAQVRGMPDEKSLTIIVKSIATDSRTRRVNVQASVPSPVWS